MSLRFKCTWHNIKNVKNFSERACSPVAVALLWCSQTLPWEQLPHTLAVALDMAAAWSLSPDCGTHLKFRCGEELLFHQGQGRHPSMARQVVSPSHSIHSAKGQLLGKTVIPKAEHVALFCILWHCYFVASSCIFILCTRACYSAAPKVWWAFILWVGLLQGSATFVQQLISETRENHAFWKLGINGNSNTV